MARIQAHIVSDKAARLWTLIPKMSKSKAIEQALLTLAQDKKLAPVFFEDMHKVQTILKGQAHNGPDDPPVETAW